MFKSILTIVCTSGLIILFQTSLQSLQGETIQANSVDQWFYEGEQNREQFHPHDFSDPNDASIITVQQLWCDKNLAILHDPLEEEMISENTVNGIRHKEFFFTSRTVTDGKVRVYAKYAAPEGDRLLPAVLHIHGGGQTISPQWLEYFANQGYAVLSFDFCGDWNNRPIFTKYPESLKHGEQKSCTNNVAEEKTEQNSWFEWTYLCRRALTCLASQPEVDSDRMGIFGISVGGTLCWMVAGTDSRVKASVPIYGAGYDYEYRSYPYYEFKKYEPRTEVKRYLQAISSEACAPLIKTPTLFLNASNDFHGHFDWSCKTYDELPVDTIRRISIAPSYNHHISLDQNQNLLLWMDAHLKNQGVFPLNPRLSISKNDFNQARIVLTADWSREIEYVKIFVALENTEAFTRYWQEMEIQSEENGLFSTETAVMDASKYLFVYASIRYKTGHHLSTEVVAVKPNGIGIVPTPDLRSRTIYTASEKEKGWAVASLPTDPIPSPNELSPLGHGDNGGVFTYQQGHAIVTYRLSDPRFFPKSDQSKLKLTFSTSKGATITIKFTNHAYSSVGEYVFTKQIDPDHPSFEVSCEEVLKGQNPLKSWKLVPIILLENTSPSTMLMQLEWIN